MHILEEDLKRHSINLPFEKLLGEAMFVTNAFTFYNGVSPCNAHIGRQPPCLPDLEMPNFDGPGGTAGHARERRVREISRAAITRSSAVSKTNRALKAKTTIDGSRLFKKDDLIDYYRTPNAKDEFGGWNGPVSVIRNEPDRGQAIAQWWRTRNQIC